MYKSGCKLHIGCGGRNLKGYINIDLYHSGADITGVDCAQTGCPENSVIEIFTSHMIEHLAPEHFQKALVHWYKILQPGGKLFMLCPNAQIYLQEWIFAARTENLSLLDGWARRNVLGWENKGEGMLNRNLFTPGLLKSMIESVGFYVESCASAETRVKDKRHIEWRPDGDIVTVAYKLER